MVWGNWVCFSLLLPAPGPQVVTGAVAAVMTEVGPALQGWQSAWGDGPPARLPAWRCTPARGPAGRGSPPLSRGLGLPCLPAHPARAHVASAGETPKPLPSPTLPAGAGPASASPSLLQTPRGLCPPLPLDRAPSTSPVIPPQSEPHFAHLRDGDQGSPSWQGCEGPAPQGTPRASLDGAAPLLPPGYVWLGRGRSPEHSGSRQALTSASPGGSALSPAGGLRSAPSLEGGRGC